MSYPNIPVQRTHDWDRKTANAVNHLLNLVEYCVVEIEGMPDAAQEVLDREFPIALTIDATSCVLRVKDGGVAPTSDAVFTVSVSGSTIGTGTIPAGETEGSWTFTTLDIPDFTQFLITAPNPQDATLSDIIIAIALGE